MSMKPRKRIAPGTLVPLRLTERQRELIREETFFAGEVLESLAAAAPIAGKLTLHLTLEDLDDLAGYVAAAANHCPKKKLQRELDQLYDVIRNVEQSYADEEP